LICWKVERCRLRRFDKHCVKGYGEGSFAEAKLQRLGNTSLIASNSERFFRKLPPDGAQEIRHSRGLSKGTGG
jgi:hypothetical protein